MIIPTNRKQGRPAVSMNQISLQFFYDLGSVMRPLASIQGGMKLMDAWSPLYRVGQELTSLTGTDWFSPAVKASNVSAFKLLKLLATFTARTDFDSELTFFEANEITKTAADFETVLRSELLVADVYYVTKKGGYDTGDLLGNAERNFPAELGVKVPRAIGDIRQAGKSLAFELSTASGFHVLRGTETVVRSYWDAVAGGAPHPKLKTIGSYAKQLEDKKLGKVKTVETLKQVASLHRNPLMHPDESLSLEDAISLFGICSSAINAMLKEIPSPPMASISP